MMNWETDIDATFDEYLKKSRRGQITDIDAFLEQYPSLHRSTLKAQIEEYEELRHLFAEVYQYEMSQTTHEISDNQVTQARDRALRKKRRRDPGTVTIPGRDLLRELTNAFAEWFAQQRFSVALAGARAADTFEPKQGQMESGALRWFIEEDYGDLIVSFGSDRIELVGTRFIVEVENLRKAVVLEVDPVTPGQVGADVVFTAAERSSLPPEAEIRVRVAHDDE